LEIPDPRKASGDLANRLVNAFTRLSSRSIGRLVEEQLMDCRTPDGARKIASGAAVLAAELTQTDRRHLDSAVFELLGVKDTEQQELLVNKLYQEVARHFRRIRVVEIQKQEQRLKSAVRRFSIDELAADAWDAAELAHWTTLDQWLNKQTSKPSQRFVIPEGERASLVASSDMYDRNAVYFGAGKHATRINCASRSQAELLAMLADLGFRGPVTVPTSEAECAAMLAQLRELLAEHRTKFEALAASRSNEERTQSKIIDLLMHWTIHGRPTSVLH
jgi:hypothetical protein